MSTSPVHLKPIVRAKTSSSSSFHSKCSRISCDATRGCLFVRRAREEEKRVCSINRAAADLLI